MRLVLFSKADCEVCVKAKAAFQKYGVAYEEKPLDNADNMALYAWVDQRDKLPVIALLDSDDYVHWAADGNCVMGSPQPFLKTAQQMAAAAQSGASDWPDVSLTYEEAEPRICEPWVKEAAENLKRRMEEKRKELPYG